MTTPPARVGAAEKAAFFGGNVGNIVFSTTINTFLLAYLTDEVGIGAAAVGTLFLVARIFDAACDPAVGYAIDHLPVTRWGRFRTYLLVGGLIGAAGFAALFLAPAWAPAPLAAAWVAYLLWGPAFALMDVPLNSLIPAVAADPADRRHLSGLKAVGYLAGGAVVVALTLPIVRATGWTAFIIGLAALSALLTANAALRVRERVQPMTAERYGIGDLGRIMFGDRAAAALIVSVIALTAADGARSAAMVYYFTYAVGDRNLVGAAALALVIPTAVGAVLGPWLARRWGAKPVFVGALVLKATVMGALMLVPYEAVPAILGAFALAGLGAGAGLTMIYVIVAELVDHIEWKHGHRVEGVMASLGSFAAKAGGGIGAALTGYLLAATGYRPDQQQSAEALRGIVGAQTLLPAALGLLAALIFVLYPISRELNGRVARELAARRAAGALVE